NIGRSRSLGADARKQDDRLRQQSPRLTDGARMRRADDRADRREPSLADELLGPLGHQLGDLVPDRAAVREDEILDLRTAGVGRLDDAEDANALAPAGGEIRLD